MTDATRFAGQPPGRERKNRNPRPRALGQQSVAALMRLLAERGFSEEQIDRGLDYVEAMGANTMRLGYVLAISRILYSDAQLAEGMRFTFAKELGANEPAGGRT